MNSFAQLGLAQETLQIIKELGFEKPSEIQYRTIPHLLEGKNDLIGLAQTGTGKTAAFAWPLLQRIDMFDNSVQALVLAPTRELVQQITQQMDTFGKYHKYINILAVYGGSPISKQIRALRQAQHIVVATPGRLLDLIRRKAIRLNQVEYAVLDEADEMLNMGFKEDIDQILKRTPDHKSTWLFSATMPSAIKQIVNTYMTNPIEVKIAHEEKVNVNIDHQFALVNHRKKTEALTRCLDIEPAIRGVVFCRTRRDTQNLADVLSRHNYKVDSLHGDLSQKQRDRVMNRFRAHELQLLVATDIAARGLDVEDLTHVFHYSLPDDKSYYTHRSGRTARAGKSGTSIALIHKGERQRIKELERNLSISFTETEIPSREEVNNAKLESWCQEVLNTPIKGRIDQNLMDRANMLFGNLSREELLAKVMLHQALQKDDKDEQSIPEDPTSSGRFNRKSRRKGRSSRGKGRRKGNRKSKSRSWKS